MDERDISCAKVSRFFDFEDLPDFFFADTKELRQRRRSFFGEVPSTALAHDIVRAVFLRCDGFSGLYDVPSRFGCRIGSVISRAGESRTVVDTDSSQLRILDILLLAFHECFLDYRSAERFYFLVRQFLDMDDLLEAAGIKEVRRECIGAQVLYRCVSFSSLIYGYSDSVFERGLGNFVGFFSPSFELSRNLKAARLKHAVEDLDPVGIQDCIDFSARGYSLARVLSARRDPMRWLVGAIKKADPDLARRAGFYGYGASYLEDPSGKLSQIIN